MGSIDVYALFRPFIEILEVITRMLVEVIQALVSAAIGLLQALAKIIGALITIVVSIVKILFPIVKWYIGMVFKLLFPVLKVVISIVSWFLNLFNARMAQRNLLQSPDAIERAYARIVFVRDQVNKYGASAPLFGRNPLSFEDADMEGGAFAQGWSSLHDSMYPSANWAASRHFSNENQNRATDTELQVMLRIIDETPLHSFSYYWVVNRPVLMRIDGGAMPSDVYTGEVGNTADMREKDFTFAQFVPHAPSARALLEFTSKRQLLSKEDTEVLSVDDPVSVDEYWHRFDNSDGREDTLAWYSHKHYEHQHKRQAALHRLRDTIRSTKFASESDYYEHFSDQHSTVRPEMSYEQYAQLQDDLEESDRISVGLPPNSRKRAHAFADDLDARHACKHKACGGKGHTLPHAVHTLRKLSHKRQARHEQISWKPPTMTDEEYQKSKAVHVHVVGHAVNEAIDTLKWHLQSPHLHQHAKNAWRRVSGYQDLSEAYEDYHRTYKDPGEWMMARIGSLSDWKGFRWLAERDGEFEKRPWFGDWARREFGSDDDSHKFHGRKLNALGPEMSGARQLLELDDPMDVDYHQEWLNREPHSDIEELYIETAPPQATTDPLVRKLHGLPFPLPDVPDVYQQVEDANARQGSLKAGKPQPKAKLPLFELLTQTDCYTTTPRNPLCLPMIPNSWQINEIPDIVWPENATADDSFCAPTFKRVDRCLTCWQTYVNWRWVYNAIQIPRLVLSSIPVFTDTLYQLGQTYPFLRWLFKLPLGKPLGHAPSTLDYICMAIYGPVSFLFTFVYFKVISMVWPIALIIIEAVTALVGVNTGFVAANAAYWQQAQERDALAIQIAMKDSPANPSLYMAGNFSSDPNYFFRGYNGRTPSHMGGVGGDAALLRDPRVANQANGGPLGQNVPNSPYTPAYPPRPEIYMQRNSPYQYDASEGTTTYLGPQPGSAVPAVKSDERQVTEAQDRLVHDLRATLSHAFMEMGVPRINPTAADIHGVERVNIFRRAWDWFVDDRVTAEDVARFERNYHPLLIPFQDSLLWWLQRRNHNRQQWFELHTRQPMVTSTRVSHFMEPVAAPRQRPEDIALREVVASNGQVPVTAYADPYNSV